MTEPNTAVQESKTVEERVSKGMVERMAVIVTGRDEDMKAQVLVKLIGERIAYEASFKVPRSVLDPTSPNLKEFFDTACSTLTKVLEGDKELNAITA